MTNIVRISRPRFWLYLFGPYLVGLAAGASSRSDLLRFDSILFGLYFFLPANLLVYGVNDIFDFETDRLNPKKVEYEMLVQPETHRALWIWIAVLNLPFIAAVIILAGGSLPTLAAFLLVAIFYSAPPVRAKQIPFLDSLFNILYILPGVFAFQMLTGNLPPLGVIVAAAFWTAAMHAYSAIPDIEADRAASVATIATLLGKTGTLTFCLGAFVAAAIFAHPYLGFVATVLCLVYVSMIAVSIAGEKNDHVFAVYKYFPLINAGAGLALFWFVAISNLL
ncbi:MAG: prenyltransferase [Acidobacteriota bacterium]